MRHIHGRIYSFWRTSPKDIYIYTVAVRPKRPKADLFLYCFNYFPGASHVCLVCFVCFRLKAQALEKEHYTQVRAFSNSQK